MVSRNEGPSWLPRPSSPWQTAQGRNSLRPSSSICGVTPRGRFAIREASIPVLSLTAEASPSLADPPTLSQPASQATTIPSITIDRNPPPSIPPPKTSNFNPFELNPDKDRKSVV